METIISFFRRRWWSFVPLIIFSGIWFMFQSFPHKQDSILTTFAVLSLLAIPGSLSLLFVRKQTIKAWILLLAMFALFTVPFLQAQAPIGQMFGSSRGLWALFLGLAFSLITVLWAVIHTLILRYNEKKANQAVVK